MGYRYGSLKEGGPNGLIYLNTCSLFGRSVWEQLEVVALMEEVESLEVDFEALKDLYHSWGLTVEDQYVSSQFFLHSTIMDSNSLKL